MKAILEFDLPEDAEEHKLALDGCKWMSVCHQLYEWLRSVEKHGNRDTIKVSEVRSRLQEEMNSAGLEF